MDKFFKIYYYIPYQSNMTKKKFTKVITQEVIQLYKVYSIIVFNYK